MTLLQRLQASPPVHSGFLALQASGSPSVALMVAATSLLRTNTPTTLKKD